MTMSDRICLMNAGAIAQLGTPADLYFRPKNVFVADFLGESNLLDATVTGREGDRVRVAIEGVDKGSAMVYDSQIHSGKDVKLMLRPQNLRVNSARDVHAGNGETLSAKLTDVMVTGGMTKLYLQQPGRGAQEAGLIASFPTNQRGVNYEIDQTLSLSWSPADAVAIAG